MGVSVSPDGLQLAVANNLANTLDLVDLKSRPITATIPVGHYPYGALFSRDGKTIYTSNWADAALSVLDAATHAVKGTIKVATDRLSNLTPWARLRVRSRAQVNVGRSAQGASRGSG